MDRLTVNIVLYMLAIVCSNKNKAGSNNVACLTTMLSGVRVVLYLSITTKWRFYSYCCISVYRQETSFVSLNRDCAAITFSHSIVCKNLIQKKRIWRDKILYHCY